MTFISCSKEFLWGKKPRGLGAAWHGVTARNGQVWSQSVKLRVCYIEIHLIESFHSIHEHWFPWILIKPQYSTEFPFNYFKTTMLYRDYLSFCHLDEKTYSVTRGTDQGQEGYVSMATLLNSQSEVSSWSSQEVNVSQPRGQCEICQGQ